MSVRIELDPSSGEPPFEQVRRWVIAAVADGRLLVGARLPTVRALATDLGIAPNTAARAYRELEALGVIETRGRNGSFVSATTDTATTRAQRMTVEHVAALRGLGVGDDAIAAMLDRALADD